MNKTTEKNAEEVVFDIIFGDYGAFCELCKQDSFKTVCVPEFKTRL